jgi:hypothetical protein
MITITLPQYITYAGNLFKCMWKRATILQAKMKTFQGLSEIAMNQAYNNMQEFIEDCLTLEMETCMKYEGEFPHNTYWGEIRLFIDKYKTQPWQLYNQMRNNVGNGKYALFIRWYAQGIVEDLKTLETWAEEVRI